MFTLIDLPYAPDGLEPVISALTLEFHHGKHLQGYVDNLNKLIAGTEYESMSLEQIVVRSASLPAPTGKPIFNNAGQILNHNLYFTQFRPSSVIPNPAGVKESPLGKQIESQWGTLEAFQKEFVAKGVGLFGSGWVWLQADAAASPTASAPSSPSTSGNTPTTSTTRTAAPRTSRPYGGLSIGA